MDPSEPLVAADVPSGEGATRSPVPYDPVLVETLSQEHRDMLALLESIRSRAERGRYAEIPAQLSRLQASLEAHVLCERLRLFGYLEHSLACRPEALSRVQAFQAEAGRLALAMKRFVDHYRRRPAAPENLNELLDGLRSLGVSLHERFMAESDELYPLYRPPAGQP